MEIWAWICWLWAQEYTDYWRQGVQHRANSYSLGASGRTHLVNTLTLDFRFPEHGDYNSFWSHWDFSDLLHHHETWLLPNIPDHWESIIIRIQFGRPLPTESPSSGMESLRHPATWLCWHHEQQRGKSRGSQSSKVITLVWTDPSWVFRSGF